MQKPCSQCPFLKDSFLSRTLDKGRKQQIVDEVTNDIVFTCHKVNDLPIEKRTVCIGSAITLEKTLGIASNFAYRFHASKGKLSIANLDLLSPVYETFADFIDKELIAD